MLKNILLIAFLLVGPSLALAGVSITSISVSNSSPSPGSVVGVTVTYCESANTTPYWLVAVNANSTTVQACSPAAPTQIFMVDNNTTPAATSPVNGTQSDASPSGNGYPGIAVPNSPPPCPYTQIFNVTIPSGTPPGPINLIVAGGDYYVQCSSGIVSQQSTVLNIPLPPPSCTASVMTEGVTAAPNGFFLFDVDYSFVNAGSSNVVYTLPPNVTYVSAGPSAVYSAGAVSWNLGNVTIPQSGVLWALVSVNSGTSNGTVIPNSATLNSAGCGTSSSAVSNVTVQIPSISLVKSENAASLNAGQTVTYNLDWTAAGDNLQLYDSYDNISAGSNTTGSSVPWGYDGTSYQLFPGPGPGTSLGAWTVGTDTTGNHFIEATVPYNGGGSGGNYPDLIRNVPGAEICDPIIVEGDLQIPTTAAGAGSGADAHMVVACNTSQGITLKVGISIDASPAHLFVQKNNIYPLPAGAGTNSLPFTITAGVWYTLKAQVQSSGSGAVTYNIQLWPKGNPTDVGTLNYTDTTAVQPICSGGWTAGWQADETGGTDWYSNLKVFGPGPILNAGVTDVVPSGVTYIGSDSGGVYNAGTSTLSWNSPGSFPTTLFSFSNPVNWWGTVACPGPITNSFTMAANSIPAVTSNTVTLAVSGCGPTPTPTATPTATTGPEISTCSSGSPSPQFLDAFPNSGSLSNYTGYQLYSSASQSMASLGYTVSGGELMDPSGAVTTSSVALLNSAQFPLNLSDYTVEADFKIDVQTTWFLMGLTFLDQASANGNGGGYAFQLDGNPPHSTAVWEIQKDFGCCTYLSGSGVTAPAYTAGNWAHLKVIVSGGTTFACYVNLYDGNGDQLVFSLTDTTGSPHYTAGGVGFREMASNANTFHVRNFHVFACQATPTPTNTPTLTPTGTPTLTPTPQPTATFTPTPVGLHVWPNPFSTRYAVAQGPGGLPALVAYQVPAGNKMEIFTVSGELVNTLSPYPDGHIYWYGTNTNGSPCAPGIYYYVIGTDSSTLLSGKILLLRD